MNPDLHILGGGPAGLAAGHYARKRGLDFRIYEAGTETGGNCRTLRLGECLFDTGAHRLHLRIPEAAAEFRSLLGDDLLRVDAPSAIAVGRRLLRFPPSPSDLLRNLGLGTLARVALELPFRKAPGAGGFGDFRAMAEGLYGKTLADMFLLNYTRKLWGLDPVHLSTQVAGGRLRGLGFKSLLPGKTAPSSSTGHLDGRFLYPKFGIGALFGAIEKRFAPGSLRIGAAVTRVRHDGTRILGITLGGAEEIETPRVISTLPLPLFLHSLQPLPPPEILAIADGISFRHLLLCVLTLDVDRFTGNASLYFPDPGVPFTRVYEPKNRSQFMAPAGQTCLVLEIPCNGNDDIWTSKEIDIPALLSHLGGIRAISADRVLQSRIIRIPNAYPVLRTGIESSIDMLIRYCGGFENLTLMGRNALFRYSHIHDLFLQAAQALS